MLKVADSDIDRAQFVRNCIEQHKNSDLYKIAKVADDYYRERNTTTMEYQRTYTTVTGEIVPDNYKAAHRTCSNFFFVIVTQRVQYILANGCKWGKDETADRVGKDFDSRLIEMGWNAHIGGVCFGFFNLDHLEVFPVQEFVPIYDEENGALASGVRFWQVEPNRPLRATHYEMDGYTNYLWGYGEGEPIQPGWQPIGNGGKVYFQPKRPYIMQGTSTDADGVTIFAGKNYPTFPIIPMWSGPLKQSEILGLREKIDAYDFIVNGFEDDLDNAQLYWIIKGAGGMMDSDLEQFLDRLKTVGAAAPADGQDVEAVEINIPYAARETLLDRIEKQIYRDAMIMNPDDIKSGATTATQIRAAYERQNIIGDQFEGCVLDFLDGLMKVAGIDDTATFTRSTIVNTQEEISTVISAGTYLSEDYITEKILNLLGDGDRYEEMIKERDAEGMERLNIAEPEQEQVEETDEETGPGAP